MLNLESSTELEEMGTDVGAGIGIGTVPGDLPKEPPEKTAASSRIGVGVA